MERSSPGYSLQYDPYLLYPSTSRFPTLGTSHLSVFPHLGLSPLSFLFLFWNLGKITSTFRLNVGTYPPCLCYPHHVYPSVWITWKCRITWDTLDPYLENTDI